MRETGDYGLLNKGAREEEEVEVEVEVEVKVKVKQRHVQKTDLLEEYWKSS